MAWERAVVTYKTLGTVIGTVANGSKAGRLAGSVPTVPRKRHIDLFDIGNKKN